MQSEQVPDWEPLFLDEVIRTAERRLELEKHRARRRAVQLSREQAYHRLAVAIDRPATRAAGPGQLSFFPADPTLFDGDS